MEEKELEEAAKHLNKAKADIARGAEHSAEHEIDEALQEIREAEKKTVTIIVEGTPHEWPKGKITYAEVVTLEVPNYSQHPEITYSVKYKKGPADKPEGVLVLGASVKVREGMVFSVSDTGQS